MCDRRMHGTYRIYNMVYYYWWQIAMQDCIFLLARYMVLIQVFRLSHFVLVIDGILSTAY